MKNRPKDATFQVPEAKVVGAYPGGWCSVRAPTLYFYAVGTLVERNHHLPLWVISITIHADGHIVSRYRVGKSAEGGLGKEVYVEARQVSARTAALVAKEAEEALARARELGGVAAWMSGKG